MQKFCCGLLISCFSVCNCYAQSQSLTIPLSIPVSSMCVLRFNVPNVKIDLVREREGSASTILNISCTNGAVVNLKLSSQNNWHLLGKYATESINYSLLYTGGGQTNGATITQTWSGGVAERIVMQGIATAAPWVIPLQIITEVIQAELPADYYSDQVIFSIFF